MGLMMLFLLTYYSIMFVFFGIIGWCLQRVLKPIIKILNV